MCKYSKKTYLFLVIILLLIILFFTDIVLGSVYIPFNEVFAGFFGKAEKNSWNYIVREIRLPKAVIALVAGAGLSTSGLLMQTLFRNPLAGPFVLGISSGASLGVAILVMSSGLLAFPGDIILTSSQIMAAIMGSMVIFILVLALSFKVRKSVSLLIVGIMLGSMTGALVSIIQYFSSPDQIQNFLLWTFGSLGNVNWYYLGILVPIVVVGLLIAFFLQKSLDAFLLGENYAFGLGVSLRIVRIWVIVSTAVITGALTAFVGPIVFVGVAVPHLARGVFQTSRHGILIPATIVFGGCLMLFCDIVSHLPGSYKVLPINSITAIVGAPVIIWVILRSKNKVNF